MRLHASSPAFQIIGFILATLLATCLLVAAGLNEAHTADQPCGQAPCAISSAK